ncbi:hypothetical protein QYH69_21825 [Paraburkholderia sp. SARCC-3016]|uniref:hypothetical protein n=1 Tax=Paraburkholderia sp. SARCC-3016 TaxID=3058611 RepID=UPI002808576E|nr:hypothetical protein [Paraburkholderia sp. SARCC-3016]MDQ7979882.1 hypothetical protein [Paraburkholderia sp. SARCC-3016]
MLAIVNTTRAQWVVPTRLTFGMLLLFPLDGGIQHLLAATQPVVQPVWLGMILGTLPRLIEIMAGISFIVGLGIRVTAAPAVVIFALRALANAAGSFPSLRDVTAGIVVPHGNWAYGALYLATALLLNDLLGTGSGRWSVDYWLATRLKALASPHLRR